MSHVVCAIPLPGPQNLWSRSLRDLDHRFESLRVSVENEVAFLDECHL